MWLTELTETFEVLARSVWGNAAVRIEESDYYIQFRLDDEPDATHRLYVETVSNEFIFEDAPLSAPQKAALVRLGWQRPQSECDPDEDCEMEHHNWYCFADLNPDPGARRRLLEMVMATLGVYGASEGTSIDVSHAASAGTRGSPYCD